VSTDFSQNLQAIAIRQTEIEQDHINIV
jgi:hypothetical protein